MSRRIVLRAVPQGMPLVSDFEVESVELPAGRPGALVVRTLWLSVDPYLRGRISGVKSYIDPIMVGQAMESSCVGVVIASGHERFAVGDLVSGLWPWQEHVVVDARNVWRVDPAMGPISTAIGILGMPGMTAYFGFLELCQPKPGESVFVSGAAGAVGSAVGQIAKIQGCRVVGSAGSAEKVQYLKSIGFDEAFNYRDHSDYGAVLSGLFPDGVDCFFDNVGGPLTDAVYPLMKPRGRVAVCGQISQYNDRSGDVGPRPFHDILVKQLRVEGFIVSRWIAQFAEGRRQMGQWLQEGKLQFEETIYEGLENAPKAFLGLFSGENTGKAIVRVGKL
jgi:NADPH:quinone reductase